MEAERGGKDAPKLPIHHGKRWLPLDGFEAIRRLDNGAPGRVSFGDLELKDEVLTRAQQIKW